MFIERQAISKKGAPRRPVYGAGINDASYVTAYVDSSGKQTICPYYKVWTAMLERCFSANLHKRRPTYKGCALQESWKLFSNFRKWMETQDWQNKVLDKDLLSWDSKCYGPDTCVFISPALNNLLTLRNNHRGKYPLGVSKTTMRGYEYFVASCSFYGKQTRLGYFKTPEDAAASYKQAKLQYMSKLAASEADTRIKQALLNLF